jgi:hypothetical protein
LSCHDSLVPSDGRRTLEWILANPPLVHLYASDEPVVWRTEDDCYRFIWTQISEGVQTLETGLGLSTAIFAAAGCHHCCITPDADEVARLRLWSTSADVELDNVRFITEPSDRVLPRLDTHVDLLLIDGAHGFPLPTIDWYYGGQLLRDGGLLVVDDTQLPAIALLIDFLDVATQWEAIERGSRWAAYRRRGSGDLQVEQTRAPAPPTYLGTRQALRTLLQAAARSTRRRLHRPR